MPSSNIIHQPQISLDQVPVSKAVFEKMFRPGRILTGRIIHNFGQGKYLLALGHLRLIATSRFEFAAGERIRVVVKRTGTEILLQIRRGKQAGEAAAVVDLASSQNHIEAAIIYLSFASQPTRIKTALLHARRPKKSRKTKKGKILMILDLGPVGRTDVVIELIDQRLTVEFSGNNREWIGAIRSIFLRLQEALVTALPAYQIDLFTKITQSS